MQKSGEAIKAVVKESQVAELKYLIVYSSGSVV
jgi:hypothetical protein